MNWRIVIKFVIIATVGATLSQIFQNWALLHWLHWLGITLLWGLLAGHLLFPQKVKDG